MILLVEWIVFVIGVNCGMGCEYVVQFFGCKVVKVYVVICNLLVIDVSDLCVILF